MLLQDVTKILKVLLAAFQPIASQDELTQRRIGQIGEVIGAVEDVAEDETEADKTNAEKRIAEAHDIIHRVARILAMEPDTGDGGGNDGGETDSAEAPAAAAGPPADEPLKEVPWDGSLEGETIELAEEETE